MAIAKHITPPPATRPIPGFPGYRIDRRGNVWSCRLNGIHAGKTGKWRLKRTRLRVGYPCVNVTKDGVHYTVNCHVFVLITFVGPRLPGMVACHNDGNRANCNLSNLRWDTYAGNAADMKIHGTALLGSKKPGAKLTEQDVTEILRLLHSGKSKRSIGRQYDVNEASILNIAKGKTWKHVPRNQPVSKPEAV